ncbi:unnamed protein product [Choristocarpus tenellus]
MEPELYRALRQKDVVMVRDCLQAWGDQDRWIWWSGKGCTLTPVHVASKGTNGEIMAELLKHPVVGKAVNFRSVKDSNTPLHIAAATSTPNVVRILLRYGADPSAISRDGSIPLHVACCRGRLATVMELLHRGSALEARDGKGMTPLLRAIEHGRATVVRQLMAKGANKKIIDFQGTTALALSCRSGSLELVQTLLDSGADLESENSEGHTCVNLAAKAGHAHIVEELLGRMEAACNRLKDGNTLLYDAVEQGQTDVTKLFIRSGKTLGIDIDWRHADKQGTAPIHCAVYGGHRKILAELLESGADSNIKDNNGLTALHLASAAPDSLPIVRMLLQAGADVDALDNNRATPIFYAFLRGNDHLVPFLLSRGSVIFRMDYNNALRVACYYGMLKEAESLLWMEADPRCLGLTLRVRGREFHTGLEVEMRLKMRTLLSEYGAYDLPEEEEASEARRKAEATAEGWTDGLGGDEEYERGEDNHSEKHSDTENINASVATGLSPGATVNGSSDGGGYTTMDDGSEEDFIEGVVKEGEERDENGNPRFSCGHGHLACGHGHGLSDDESMDGDDDDDGEESQQEEDDEDEESQEDAGDIHNRCDLEHLSCGHDHGKEEREEERDEKEFKKGECDDITIEPSGPGFFREWSTLEETGSNTRGRGAGRVWGGEEREEQGGSPRAGAGQTVKEMAKSKWAEVMNWASKPKSPGGTPITMPKWPRSPRFEVPSMPKWPLSPRTKGAEVE